jgi:DNA-binding transcriptional LysR family regulator
LLAQESSGVVALGLNGAQATDALRLAAPSIFAQLCIAPRLPAFADLHRGLNLRVVSLNLIKGGGLMECRLARDGRILCASPAAARHGPPRNACGPSHLFSRQASQAAHCHGWSSLRVQPATGRASVGDGGRSQPQARDHGRRRNFDKFAVERAERSD